ncbi:MAG: F0F1 ATP synthase subunit A [Bacillota bacterium]|nr:F0F1 ATP synthase subunit A [Bacillota bacterium]
MGKKQKKVAIGIAVLAVFLLIGSFMIEGMERYETIRETMRDAVLHTENKINILGLTTVNPALMSAFVVTIVVLFIALLIRLLVIPRFTNVPGKFQMLLEMLVGFFSDLAKQYSPHCNKFLGAYIFAAGVYIFVGTISELFGIQFVTTHGASIAMPAPLSDINGAISMGVLSYLAIMSGGIKNNGVKGIGLTLKEFSLPISMSFRLFGALLSGLLVTELVYYTISLSYVLPVLVAIMFTLLHALIQTYVLTLLTSIFYGEVSEVSPKKEKVKKQKKVKKMTV